MATGFFTCKYGSLMNVDDLFVKKDYAMEGGVFGVGAYGVGLIQQTPYCTPVAHITANYRGNFKQVAAMHTNAAFAIDCAGLLWAWGCNFNGDTGLNSTLNISTPVQIAGTWKCISVSKGTNAAAIKKDGSLWMWGDGGYGQLGNNSTASRSSPVQTTSATCCWKEVVSGTRHTLAIKNDGTLWAWGDATFGQLGNSSTANKSTPVQVGADTDWATLPSSLPFHASYAIKKDGTLWSWGIGTNGVLGIGSTSAVSSPVQVVANDLETQFCKVTSFFPGVAAISTAGRLYMWGLNCCGMMGIGDATSTLCILTPQMPVCGDLPVWSCVHMGCCYTVIAQKHDGYVWGWGNNNRGVLGNNSTLPSLTPVQAWGSTRNWISISVGGASLNMLNLGIAAETTQGYALCNLFN